MLQAIPFMDMKNNPTGCCPVFNPDGWDTSEFSFSGLRFISVPTRSILHIPLDMGHVMKKTQKAIDEARAAATDRYLMLSEELSPWKARHYILVSGEIPGYHSTTIEGIWYASVFDGPYRLMGTWMDEVKTRVKKRGSTASRFLAFYTTCPRCSQEYHHSYVVLFALISS